MTDKIIKRKKVIYKILIALGVLFLITFILKMIPNGIGFILRLLLLGYVFLGVFTLTFYPFKNNTIKKSAFVLRLIFILVMAAALISFVIVQVKIGTYKDDGLNKECDYAVVLGAGVNGRTPSLSLLSRLEKCEEYLNTHKNAKAILSGGQGEGEDITEALAMKEYLVKAGIDEKRLILEEESTSTKENIKNSIEIIEKMDNNIKEIMIITNDFHCFRGAAIAKKMGFTPFVCKAPTPDLLYLKANLYIREYFAVMFNF